MTCGRAFPLTTLLIVATVSIVSCTVSIGNQPGPCPLNSQIGCGCPGTIPCQGPGFLFVTAAGQILVSSVDQNTGVPTQAGSTPGPNRPGGILEAGGNFVYVSDSANNQIDGFIFNGTSLTPIPGSPFSGVNGPLRLASDSRFLFVPEFNGNSVAVFAIGQSGGLTAVPGSPFPAGGNPVAAALNLRSPQFLYVSNATGAQGEISGYTVDPNTGALTALPGSPFPVNVNSGLAGIVVSDDNKFVYVALTLDSSVAGFAIDPSSGALTPVPGSPVAAGSSPIALAFSSTGSYLYAANALGNNVSGFSVGSNGALQPIPGSPFPVGMGPVSLAVGNSMGQDLYVANAGGNSVSAFSINATSGALTPLPGSPYPMGTKPNGIIFGH